MNRRRTLLLAVAVFGGLLAGPAPAAAQQTLAVERRASLVSVHDGTVVWSRANADRTRFSLMSWRGGRVRRLPVRSRSLPFDVDLGPGPAGGVWAVYSRCRGPVPRAFGGLPDPGGPGQRCQLYRYDFASGRERRLPRARNGASRVLPAIWRGRIAYAEVGRRRGPFALVRTSRLSGAGARTVGRGRRGETADTLARGRPLRVDLRGSTVAFDWRYGVRDCESGADTGDPISDFGFEVWQGTPGRVRPVERACENDPVVDVGQPSLGSRGLAYLRTEPREGVPPTRLLFAGPPGPSREVDVPGSPRAASADGDLVAAVTDTAPGTARRYEVVVLAIPPA